jgi:UDPglucose 6-dehydrogenase
VTVAPTGFVGLSHLGIVSSVGWASLIGPVVAVDSAAPTVAQLEEGRLPVHEPSLPELFDAVRSRMRFTTDPSVLSACPLVVVARDVPTDDNDVSDVSAVLALVEAAVPHLRSGVTLVIMSQVPPGFTRALGARIAARRPGLDVRLYYWVETLVFGQAVERYVKPERIILGCRDPERPLPAELADAVGRFGCPVVPMRYESAELAKTAINLYLCAAVTYANTLADLCEAVGADWTEMMPALRLDRRIGPAAYIRPGLGIAGGNLERDMMTLRDLSRDRGVDSDFIDVMLASNARRVRWVERTLATHVFPEIDRPTVAVWGLAYKRDTRSTKNSMALRVVRALQGRCDVRAWDPLVTAADIDVPVKVVGDRDEALVGADCLLVLTDWGQFAVPPPSALAAMRRKVIIDGVGIVDASRVDRSTVRLVAMGRG